MVIFGAGASFDSSPTYPVGMGPPGASQDDQHNEYYRPPLAKDLFANRPIFIDALELFPQCKAIVPRLRDPGVTSGEKSIETLLQEIEAEAMTYARGRQETAAIRCYLQRAIAQCEARWLGTTRRITNYLRLAREIDRTHKADEPVCLVTFNYDTLLEDALAHLNLKVTKMEDYWKGLGLFRVFKLHGSVNWGNVVTNRLNINLNHPPSVLQHCVERIAEIGISQEFALCPATTMGVADGRPVFPVIAIPVEKKQEFACPQPMIDELISLLPQIDKVLVIGWRASEDHFLELLKHHLNKGVGIWIVAGEDKLAEQVSVRIHKALLNNPPHCSAEPTGFTDFIRTRRLEAILSG